MSCENYNICDEFKSLELEEVQNYAKSNSLPFGVACFNIKGSLNTGTIIRTACCFGARSVFILGPSRFDRRSLVGAANYIEVTSIEISSPRDLNYALWNKGYYPVFIEQGGKDLQTFKQEGHYNPCIVFGSESGGIPSEYLNSAHHYSISQFGVLRSLNVSAAAAISIHYIANLVKK